MAFSHAIILIILKSIYSCLYSAANFSETNKGKELEKIVEIIWEYLASRYNDV